MKYFPIVLLIILPFTSRTQSEMIEACYTRYNQALKTGNPTLAYNQLSVNARRYLDSCIYNAGVSDNSSLCKLKPIDRFFILVTRQLLKSLNIDFRKSTSAYLFNIMADNELITPLKSSTVTKFKIDSSQAYANLKIGDITYPFILDFYKEIGGWKFDFMSLYTIEAGKIKRMAESNNIDVNQMIESRVEAKTSMQILPTNKLKSRKIYKENSKIWIPLKSLLK